MEIRLLFNLARRWWWLIGLGLVVAMTISYMLSKQVTPTYRTTTRLFINQVETPGVAGYQDLLTSERLARTYAELLRSRPILEETARQLGVSSVPAPTVRVVRDTALLEVTITDTDPVRAAATANQLAQVFIQRSQDLRATSGSAVQRQMDEELDQARQRISDTSIRLSQLRSTPNPSSELAAETQRLQLELAQYQDTYARLFATQQQAALAQAQAASSISVAEYALVPGGPIGPNIRQNLLIAAFLGLALTVGLALLYEYLDDRVRDPEEVRRLFNIPPLAVIGRMKGDRPQLLNQLDKAPDREFTESLRLLRTNLDFVTMGGPVVVCISSAIPKEGKSTIAANLALIEAQAGKRVVLVDADLRNPSAHRMFDLPQEQGLSTFLAQTPPSERPLFQEGPLGVRVLTSGPVPPNPSELLNAARLGELLTLLRSEVDLVIIDSAPLLPIADTLVLQRLVDHLVLVVDIQRTGTRTLGRVFTMLEQASAKVAGIVLNKDTRRIDQYGYGYGYGYGSLYGSRYGYGKLSEKAGD